MRYDCVHWKLLSLIIIPSFLYCFPLLGEESLQAQDQLEKGRLIDRIALSLTDEFPDSSAKAKVLSGEWTLEQFFDAMKSSNGVQEKLARYWMSALGVRNLNVTLNRKGLTFRVGGNYQYQLSLDLAPHKYNWRRTRLIGYNPSVYGDCDNFDFQLMAAHTQASHWHKANSTNELAARNDFFERGVCGKFVDGTGPDDLVVKTYYASDAEKAALGVLPISVNPWWTDNPEYMVTTFPKTLEPPHCGPRLRACFPPRRNGFEKYHDHIYSYAFGTEPGAYIAKLILTDRPFAEAVTGKNTALSGIQAHFLERWGARLYESAIPLTFDKHSFSRNNDGKTDFASWHDKDEPTKVFEFKDLEGNKVASVSDESWHFVEREGAQAGVLTTPVFHLTYNGERAKATAALKAFHCRQFKALPDSVQQPSNEPDLTKRQYCRDCHATLDPLSRFFGRWPDRVRVNFDYYPGEQSNLYPRYVSDEGSFLGKTGKDLPALASILVESSDFDRCAVTRAFEFAFGRQPTKYEAIVLLPKLLKTYKQSEKRLWPVIKAAFLSENFRKGVQK